MKTRSAIILLVVVAILVASLLFALQYMPLFEIESIRVSGVGRVPQSVEQLIAPLYGTNRFRVDRKALESQIASSAAIDECVITFSFPADMNVFISITEADALLLCEDEYYLIRDSYPMKLTADEMEFLSAGYCVVEVDKPFISYLSNWGVPEDFILLLTLANNVKDSEGNLITRIKYDNNSTGSSGGLVFYLEPLNACLCVRDRVSQERIRESIQIIRHDVSLDAAGSISAMPMIRYDLYSDALVRRSHIGSVS